MRPLSAMTGEIARSLRGVIFDLDDTFLDHQRLGERAYGALHRLRESGLSLVACTGRPAGWADVLARQWPIDAAIAENGAIAFVVAPSGPGPTRCRRVDGASPEERRRRRAVLEGLADEIVVVFPGVERAEDNSARITDVTLDIGEFRTVPASTVDAIAELAATRGVRTFRSSVHLHLTLETDDKGSGTLRLLGEAFGQDVSAARYRWAYVGDSENDAKGFSTFLVSVGVANVVASVGRLTVPPRYVTPSPRGDGFAELADHLVRARS